MSAATHQAPRCNGTGSALPALRITGLSKTFGADARADRRGPGHPGSS